MAHESDLTDLQAMTLSAVYGLGNDAYGMTIHMQVEELSSGIRGVSLGSVYTTLDRLEQKGYVKSWFADPTAERGGRAKRFFEMTGTGERALATWKKVSASVIGELGTIGGVA